MVVAPTLIRMFRGDTKAITLTIQRNNAAVNLTGMTIWLTAKRKVSDLDAAAIFQKSTAGGIVVSSPATAGIAVATIAPADTSGLEDEILNLVCDVQVKDSGGTITTVSSFTLQVLPDVTRTTT